MTILTKDTERDIRNAAMSALHYIAFEMKCEVSDVIATLPRVTEAPKPLPEGQGHRATAPRGTSAAIDEQPAEAKTSGEEPFANGSGGMHGRCEPIPPSYPENAPDPAQAGEPRNSPAPNPDQGQPSPPPSAVPDASDDVLRPDAAGDAMAPPKVASPAPTKRGPYKSKHETINSRVRAAYEANPGLTSRQLAEVMGEDVRRVQDALARLHLQVRRPTGAEMSAVLSASKGVTTAQRILDLITEQPDLLRQEIADRIGVKHQYVLRVCRKAGVTCPPLVETPEIVRKPGRAPYAGAEPDDDPPEEATEAVFTPSGWVSRPKPAFARPEARQAPLTASEIAAIEAKRRAEAERIAKAIRPEPPREPDAAPKMVQPKPRARFFRMKDKTTGLYLHWSAEQMTKDVKQAWRGTAAQVQGCKRVFKDIAGPLMVVVADDAKKSAEWV